MEIYIVVLSRGGVWGVVGSEVHRWSISWTFLFGVCMYTECGFNSGSGFGARISNRGLAIHDWMQIGVRRKFYRRVSGLLMNLRFHTFCLPLSYKQNVVTCQLHSWKRSGGRIYTIKLWRFQSLEPPGCGNIFIEVFHRLFCFDSDLHCSAFVITCCAVTTWTLTLFRSTLFGRLGQQIDHFEAWSMWTILTFVHLVQWSLEANLGKVRPSESNVSEAARNQTKAS